MRRQRAARRAVRPDLRRHRRSRRQRAAGGGAGRADQPDHPGAPRHRRNTTGGQPSERTGTGAPLTPQNAPARPGTPPQLTSVPSRRRTVRPHPCRARSPAPPCAIQDAPAQRPPNNPPRRAPVSPGRRQAKYDRPQIQTARKSGSTPTTLARPLCFELAIFRVRPSAPIAARPQHVGLRRPGTRPNHPLLSYRACAMAITRLRRY